jgi:gluconokinase
MVIILMGVSGSGKTTIGRVLANELGWHFYDADDFHTPANKQKMSAGAALTDADRWPWLERLATKISRWASEHSGAVLACSALKQSYRELLDSQVAACSTVYIHLTGDKMLIAERLASRRAHYMPIELLASQYEILEQCSAALPVDVSGTPVEIVAEIRSKMNL